MAVAVAAGTAVALGTATPHVGTAASAQPLTPDLIDRLSTGPAQPVIVLLRDQHPDEPASTADGPRRLASTRADQAPLVNQVRRAGGTHVTQFSVVNGFAATMSRAERDKLASDPRVSSVVPDLPVRVAPMPAEPAPGNPARPAGPPGPAASGACPANPVTPQLEPEALQATKAAFTDQATPQAQHLATGKGVTVAFLADGIDTANPDFVRPDGSKVFADYQDFTGEGTAVPGDDREAFGDASSVAAQGRQSYDLSSFVNAGNALPAGCTARVRGIAPDVSLVGLKVIAANGFGSTSAVVRAIDYAVNADHVNVINESLGSNPYPDGNSDPFSLANRAAVAAGTTVVASSGDAGYGNTEDSPASDPAVISVGASTTYRVMAQTRRSIPGFTGTWQDDNISAVSSGGVAQHGRVDDLVAPGDENWALCTADPKLYIGCKNYRGEPAPLQVFGGTSEAAPLVAGAAALVIQAYADSHGGAKANPALVKQILTSTATDEYDPSDRQGAGLLDALAAVRAAKSIQDSAGTPAPQGDGLLFGTGQLTATGAPNTPESFGLSVTNVGAAPQTVSAHGRALSDVLADQRGSVLLDTTAAGPNFTGPTGAVDDYVTTTFTVPANADHLDASISWTAPGGNAVTMVLLDPKGAFAGYSMPQAPTGPDFGHVDVHTPESGRWTALIYSPRTAAGFTGPVSYRFTSSRYLAFGAVSGGPLTLAPGHTALLTVTANTPATAGDQAAAVELDTIAGQRFSVPLVLRSLIGGDGTFRGTLTGGNGRSGSPAQQNTYQFDMPGGHRDAGVSVTLRGDVNQAVFGYLVSPDGQIVSQATNVRAVNSSGSPTAFSDSVQSYVRAPQAGRWSYVVATANPVSGSATSEEFTGQLTYDSVDIAADHVPDGTDTVLPGGKPVTATVRVHNTGAAPAEYFVDPRSSAMADLHLIPGSSAANVPLSGSASTTFLVPTGTSGLIGVTSGSLPVSADLFADTGEPEVFGPPGPGDVAVAFLDSPAVSQGIWGLEADQVGPFGTAAAPGPGTVNFALVAHTRAFDPTVTSSTGDRWLGAVLAQAPAFHPVSVDPGASGTITVTITPTAPKGSQVTGFLYVDDTSVSNAAGDELTAIPYSYTVG